MKSARSKLVVIPGEDDSKKGMIVLDNRPKWQALIVPVVTVPEISPRDHRVLCHGNSGYNPDICISMWYHN